MLIVLLLLVLLLLVLMLLVLLLLVVVLLVVVLLLLVRGSWDFSCSVREIAVERLIFDRSDQQISNQP
jgi:hypothetical protein